MLTGILETLNTNKYIYAIAMILLNVGARYIEIDLDDGHKKFLASTAVRRLLIFTVAFIATRDVVAALIITSCFVIIVLNLFNTTSKYCILPKNIRALDLNGDGYISPKEIAKAFEILKKAGKI
jgi:hypothetical protein|tara:strand:+ start:264 stop:635 length:372 start_codon:yes stop_codon:yes gene_type:complete